MVLDKMQVLSQLLKKDLKRIQKKNPQYSLRAFAKRLGISSSALSEIIGQKRIVSKKRAAALVSKLALSESDLLRFEKAYSNVEILKQLDSRTNKRIEIMVEKSQFDLMADWRFFAFMALIKTSDFKNNVKWISRRLGIEEKEVVPIIEKLKSLSIISVDHHGQITDNNITYRTSEDFPAEIHRERQLNGLTELVRQLKSKNAYQFGAFSTITTDIKKMDDAKIMIEDFLKKLSLFLCDSKDRTEVFELQIQLFPRTKPVDL